MGGLYTRLIKEREDTTFFYVINARRPFQSNSLELVNILEQIRTNVRLDIDYLINNTNLAYETTVEDLVFGQKIVEDISKITGIPIAFASGTKEILQGFTKEQPNINTMELSIYTRLSMLD